MFHTMKRMVRIRLLGTTLGRFFRRIRVLAGSTVQAEVAARWGFARSVKTTVTPFVR